MGNIITIIAIIISIGFVVYVNFSQKRRRPQQIDTYSYTDILKYYVRDSIFIVLISLLIYIVVASAETATSIGVILFLCLTASVLYNLFTEYQAMRRGAKKTNKFE